MVFLVAVLGFVVFAQAPAGPPRDTGASRTGAASLSGRVTERGSGLPLPRIVVTIESPASTERTITDAEGKYAFTAVRPGEYVLWAGPDAHRSTYLPQRFGGAEPLPRAGARGTQPNLTLAPGEARDSADIVLWRSLAIEGRVLNPSGEPMARVSVGAMFADGRRIFSEPAYTDDLGGYRVYGLAPGRYKVCATIEGGPVWPDNTRFVRTCHLAALRESDGSDIVLTTADATGIEIRVQRQPTYVITGRVLDSSGRPVDGAHVNASSMDSLRSSGASASTVEGQFTIRGLLPGRYLLSSSVGGASRGDPNPSTREREKGFAEVAVNGANVDGLSLVLSKASTIAGSVVFDGKAAPSPRLLRMMVQATLADWASAMMEPAPEAAVDDGLRFELKDLYPQRSVVMIRNLPNGWAVRSITLDDRDITHVPLDLTRASGQLRVTLTSGVAQPSVRVSNDGDPPAPSYQVVVGPADPAKWRFGLTPVLVPATSDGLSHLGSLSPGDYLLAAVSGHDGPLVWSDPSRLEALRQIATPISLSAGDRPTIDLRVVRLPSRGDQ